MFALLIGGVAASAARLAAAGGSPPVWAGTEAASSQSSIAFDAVTTSTSSTFDHTASAETDWAFVSYRILETGNDDAVTLDRCTFGGQAMNKLVEGEIGRIKLAVFELRSPPTGTQEVACFRTGRAHRTMIIAQTWEGVASLGTAVIDSAQTGEPSISLSATSADVVIDWLAHPEDSSDDGPDAGGSQTRTACVRSVTGSDQWQCSSRKPGESNATMSWSTTNDGSWVQAGVALKPDEADSGANPIIELSTQTLELTAPEGGESDEEVVTIRNAGEGRLDWEATGDAEWLQLTPRSGSLEAGQERDIRVGASAAELDPGEHSATITFRGNADNSPQTVAVRLTVEAADPVIGLSTQSLQLTAPEGGESSEEIITITNTGDGILEWEAVSDVEWLELAPRSGTLESGASEDLRVRASAADLEPGDYTGTITISGNGVNSPQMIRVELAVGSGSLPMMQVSTGTLSFDVTEGTDPPPRTMTLMNGGGGVLEWSATSDAAWVTVTPGDGALGAAEAVEVTIEVEAADLSPGSYSAEVSFAGNAMNAPLSVAVDLDVAIQVTIEQLIAELTRASTLTEGQIRFLDSIGNGNGRFDLGDFLAWLDADASSSQGGHDDGDGDDGSDD